MDELKTIYGCDLPESELAKAMKMATVVRQRKYYPMIELSIDGGQEVMNDMLAWVVRLEDYAIVQAVYDALVDGRLDSGIVLSAKEIEDILRKQTPMRAYGYCPRCRERLYYGADMKYCGRCGQAIVWEENTSVNTRDTKYEEE